RDRAAGEADGLDRVVQLDLVAGDAEAFFRKNVGDVAGRNRTVELAGFTCRTNDDEGGAVELLGNGLGFGLALEVAGFELRALTFELLLVGFVGAQRLALGQQEIARET